MQMDSFLTLKGSNVELVGAPETIFVLPIGHVVSSKGEFDVDDESYKAMKAQIAKRGVELASERGLTTWGKRWGVRGSVSIGLIAEAAKEHAESYKMSVGACGLCEA